MEHTSFDSFFKKGTSGPRVTTTPRGHTRPQVAVCPSRVETGMRDPSLVPMERIERAILVLRGQRVVLDADLSALNQVETKALVRAIKRNIERFPAEFMFRLSEEEFERLRRQFGTSSSWGGRRCLPYSFTEQGVAMLFLACTRLGLPEPSGVSVSGSPFLPGASMLASSPCFAQSQARRAGDMRTCVSSSMNSFMAPS